MRRLMFVFAAMCAAGTALAATRYWNPTVTSPVGKDNFHLWKTAENWLDDDGNTGVPQAGDDVVFARGNRCYGSHETPALNSLTLKSSGDFSQLTFVFPGGSRGMTIASSAPSTVHNYGSVKLTGDGDVPFDIAAGKTFQLQKSILQGGVQGTDYTEGATLVKKGAGSFYMADSQWTAQCTYKKTRVEAGSMQFYFAGSGGNKGARDFFPDGHDFMFAGSNSSARLHLTALDLRMQDVKFHERDDVGSDHGITCNSTTNVYLRFTGTPQLESTVFSGKLYSSVGISWETADPSREFVFSNSVSATTGGLLVSNGTMRVVHGASFTSLSNIYVAAGAKFKVEKGAGNLFFCKLLDVEDDMAEVYAGENVVLSFRVARVGGVPLDAGVYSAEDLPWLKGLGRIRVGDVPVVGEDAVWWERADGPTVLAANATTNYVGARLSGEALSFTAGEGALAFIGTNGFVTAGDGATYTWGWPTCLEGVQSWNVAAGDTLEITGDLTGLAGAAVRKDGEGTVKLTGAKTYTGNMVFSNGTVVATGDDSLGGPDGTTTFEMSSETRRGILQVALEPGKSEVSFHRPVTFHYAVEGNWGNFLILPANATVNFYGLMSTSDAQPRIGPGWPCHWYMTCPDTTTVHWYGGMFAQLDHKFPGGHHYMHKAMTGGDRFTMTGANTVLELLAPSNSVGGATGNFTAGTLYTRVPYALANYAWGRSQMLTFTGGGKIDLCGNDQELAALHSKNTGSAVITSATPAFMRLTGTWHPGSSNGGWEGTATNRVKFTGAAGLSMEKGTNYWLWADCPTTGTLQVVKGRVTISAGRGFWTNAVAAVVKGGELVLEHVALGTNTVVRFEQADSAYGKLRINAGVKQKVSALEVDGIVQRAGLYGSSESIAQYKRNDLFAGSGLLKVGEPIGLTVVIR